MSRQLTVNKQLPRDYVLAKKLTDAAQFGLYSKGRVNGKEVSNRWWKRCEELWRLVK